MPGIIPPGIPPFDGFSSFSFAIATSGNMSTAKVTSTKLTFNPSTGTLAATEINSLSDVNKKENITKLATLINENTKQQLIFIETVIKLIGIGALIALVSY